MKIKHSMIAAATLGLLFAGTGCRKYLDVNDNPNVARTVTPQLLLPSAEATIGSAMGVDFQINGGIWAQFWTQATTSSQYKTLEQYQPGANSYDRVWGLFYNQALTDLKSLDSIALATNNKQYAAISRLLQAYSFQMITDAWGDVPFTEAIKGSQDNGGITDPHFDPQEVVYNGIIGLIEQGTALIDPTDPSQPGADDLIFGGDMDLWKKFANTLKLRVYLRLAYKNPAQAQAGIAALYASGEGFLEEGEDAQINYTSTPGNQNPLYSEEVGLSRTQNLVASATVVDSMNANNDPRALVFFLKSGSSVVGLAQGNYNAPTNTPVSYPSPVTGARATSAASAEAPVKLLTGYESLFLQSEAAARGWGDAGMDEELFYRGIFANFLSYGLVDNTDSSAYSDYVSGAYWGMYPTGGGTEEKVQHIITQKWFSMTGNQGFEAWTEWRRTGYPTFFTVSKTSIIGNIFPQRFLYPNTELTRNANFPGQKTVKDKVWWDAKD